MTINMKGMEFWKNQQEDPRRKKVEDHWKQTFSFDNDEFKEQTGVDIYAIRDFRPKMAMLLSWESGTPEKRQKITNFVKQYGEKGISAFINILENENSDELILDIGEKVEPEKAEIVFSKIYELSVCIEKISNELADAFIDVGAMTPSQLEGGKLTATKVASLKSIENITAKINEIVSTFHSIVTPQEEITDEKVDKFIADLENSKTEIILLSTLLKTAKEAGMKLTPEDIRGMDVVVYEIGELGGEKKEEFRKKYEKPVTAMMEKSYAKIFAANPKAREKVRGNFEERFDNLENYRIYVLMFQGEAVAFSVIRLGDAEGEVISESTVVHPDAQKYSLGIAFLKKIMERESEKYTIRGKTRVNNPANDRYEEIGLKIDRERPKFIEEGEEYYWLKMESKRSGHLQYDKAA